MYRKTAAAFGLAAASGAMATYNVAHPAYPVNTTTPSPVYQYYNTTVPTTVVVPQFTTVCPEHTTLSYNGVQYTVTKGETITVTDCPCTITTAVPTITSSLLPPGVTPTVVVPAVPGPSSYPAVPHVPAPPPPAAGKPPSNPNPNPNPNVPVPAGAAPAVPGSPAPANPSPYAPGPGAGTGAYKPAPAPTGSVTVSGAAGGSRGVAAAVLVAAFVGLVGL